MLRLALLGLLVLAHSGWAADACLNGGALLGDQRALAALRTTIDAACPCDTASSRKGYQRCARAQIDLSLAGQTLRAQCRHTATDLYRNTTCGTVGKVTCGQVTSTGNVSCRVKNPAACRSHGRIAAHACGAELTHCGDVVDWTAGTCTDVRTPGAYHVGAQIITFTKPSAVDSSQSRPLATYIWYPTTATGPLDPTTQGILNAPVSVSGAPLIMFSHGSCGFPGQSTFFTTLLASRGFIVVAPPHPGNTLSEFPACGSSTNQTNSFIERPQDIKFVLDQMLAANQDAGSPFFGTIDPTRLGMSGHSFGGLTTQLVIASDARYVAAVPMAPATLTNPTMHIPSLTMTGANDTVANNTPTRTAYDRSDPPKYWLSLLNAGHFAFSNNCFPNSPDCAYPARLTQAEVHPEVLRYLIPFMEVYVAGDETFRPFLDAAGIAGAVYESVTAP